MQIHRIRCRFGRLDGTYQFEPDRLTLVIEDNEVGKTTLAEAILVALYGFERGKVGRSQRARFLPFGHGPCFVEVELTARSRHLLLRRTIIDSTSDTLQVSDLDAAADVTAEVAGKSRTAGESLTGLTRDQFLKICLIRHAEVSMVRDGQSLTNLVQKKVDTSAGNTTAIGAIHALETGLNSYQGRAIKRGMVQSEIAGLQQEITQLRNDERQLRESRSDVDTEVQRLNELDEVNELDRHRMNQLTYLASKAEVRALTDSISSRDVHVRQVGELQQELAALETDAQFPLNGPVRLEVAWREVLLARQASQAREEAERVANHNASLARDRLGHLGAVASWTAEDRDEVVTTRTQLRTGLTAHETARKNWNEAYQRAPSDARDIFSGVFSPFADLSDDERRALLNYRSARAAATVEIGRLQRALDARLKMRRLRERLLWVGLGLALVGLVSLALQPVFGAVVLLLGVGLGSAAWLLRGPSANQRGQVTEQVEAEHEFTEAEDRLAKLDSSAAAIAAKVGVPNPDHAADALARYLAAQGTAVELQRLHAVYQSTEANARDARRTAAGLLQRAGKEIIPDQVHIADLDQLDAVVNAAVAARAELAQAEEVVLAAPKEVEEAAEQLRSAHDAWRELCRQLAVPDSSSEDALERARIRADRHTRWDSLQAQLRGLQSAAPSVPDGAASQLRDQRERLAEAETGDASLVDLIADRAPSEYLAEQAQLAVQRQRRQEERTQLLVAIGAELVEFRKRFPNVQQATTDAISALAAAQQFNAAVSIALQTLNDVATESYEAWAEALTKRAAVHLRYLAPNYPEVRFNETLEFNVLDEEQRPWSSDEIQRTLSIGAHDRIYLAVRLALADFCSPDHDALPLILDDPFVTSDDDRFAASLRFLMETVSRQHQVIILTCHRQRHETLQRRDADLWSERVHLLSLVGSADVGA